MALNTYVPLDKVTLSGTASTVTLSSIPQGYTDLVLVFRGGTTAVTGIYTQFNGDTGSNYSYTKMYGYGSGSGTGRATGQTKAEVGGAWSSNDIITLHIQNYSNTNTFKTTLYRQSDASDTVTAGVTLWRSTSAITSIIFSTDATTFTSGSVFSLYGIKPWSVDTTPKATGGVVTSDATYWYHTFPFSGSFVPNQTLTCDYMIVAGGGGSGGIVGAGAGAGGYRSFTSASITAGTYPVVIGAGGGPGYYGGGSGTLKTAPSSGSASTFNGYSAAGGGAGGYFADGSFFGSATSGGSGGGGSRSTSAGAGNTPSTSPSQGNAGGTGQSGAPYYNTGGGGGAGAAGGNAGSNSGDGGVGVNWLSLGVYYAGGGGGAPGDAGGPGAGGLGGGGNGNYGPGIAGSYATGGGAGGGSGGVGGAGGGGVVIVRYAKA